MEENEIRAVEEILPHRPPFLFVSRIISLELGKGAVTEYDVPVDLPIFQGHFPGEPIVPGVIILEVLAQSSGLAFLAQEGMRGRVAYLAGVDSARFRKPVRPGETIRAETSLGPVRRGIGRATAKAYVGDEEVASATVLFALPN